MLRLLKAFSIFVRETTRDVQLVLSGVSPSEQVRFGKAAADLGLTKQIVLLGYVSDEAIISLLKRSVALVFPSLYEGFGVPILEAMAVGAPVIASTTTAIPEVAGSAAILVDPTDEHAIAEAMRECHLNDRTRDDLRTRGLARVKYFNWQRTAEETLSAYKKALYQ